MSILDKLKRPKRTKRKIQTISTVFIDKGVVTDDMVFDITRSGRLLIDIDDYRYIKSLNSDKLTTMEDSTFPENFYKFIDTTLYDRVYIIFDPKLIIDGNKGFMDLLFNVDKVDAHVFLSSDSCFAVYASFEMIFDMDDIRELDPAEKSNTADIKIV